MDKSTMSHFQVFKPTTAEGVALVCIYNTYGTTEVEIESVYSVYVDNPLYELQLKQLGLVKLPTIPMTPTNLNYYRSDLTIRGYNVQVWA